MEAPGGNRVPKMIRRVVKRKGLGMHYTSKGVEVAEVPKGVGGHV